MRRIVAALLAACLLACMLGCSAESSSRHEEGALAAGAYSVTVSLEGGMGKASVASPAQLDVAPDGSMTATVVWSSSHYDLMVVDGCEYRPITTEPGSTFEIPAQAMGEDLPVQARTTAMSEPHLIDYTLRFELVDGASAASSEDAAATAGADTSGDGAGAQPVVAAGLPSADLGNGWKPTGGLELRYATQFAMDAFDGGYRLLRIADGQRFLLVPAGADAPTGIAEDIVVLRQPIGDVYLAASDAMCLFDALGALDAITVSGIARDNWAVPAAVEAMDAGRIVYGGKYNMPDYDTLLAKGCRLAIESTMINHTPDVRDKLVELGIPVLTERSSYEADPLGRAEWVKFYGAMLGKDAQAERLFDAQVAKAQAVDGADTGKSVAYFYINSNGAAVARKPGDYVTRMISQAGGRYIFDSLGDDAATSSVTMEMERFYAEAKDADIIVYNATIDGGVASVQDLVSKNGLLADFKAVRTGDVWVTQQDMYQHMMDTGQIIADFNAALSGDAAELTYLRKLG